METLVLYMRYARRLGQFSELRMGTPVGCRIFSPLRHLRRHTPYSPPYPDLHTTPTSSPSHRDPSQCRTPSSPPQRSSSLCEGPAPPTRLPRLRATSPSSSTLSTNMYVSTLVAMPVAISLPNATSPPHRSTIYQSDLRSSCFYFYALHAGKTSYFCELDIFVNNVWYLI
jgi:hypothetical protein